MSEPTPPAVDPDIVSGRALTPEEDFWVDIHEDNVKLGVPRLNDAIGRLLTLATALTGGAILWLKDVCPDWSRLPATFLFIGAVGVAVWAAIPYSVRGNDRPPEIAARHDRACARKRLQLWVIGGLIWGGFFLAFVGAVAKAVAG